MMNKVSLGVFLCMASLIMLNNNQTALGLVAFIFGIVLMYGGKWPRR